MERGAVGRSRAWMGRLVRVDLAAERVHRAVARRRPDRDRRRSAGPRRSADKPHDPEAYDDITAGVIDAMPAEPVDAIGFSLGAITLLQRGDAAARSGSIDWCWPESAHRCSTPTTSRTQRIVAALEGHGDPDDNLARMFVQYASQSGNDIVALTALMKRPRRPLTPEMLAAVTCPTLVVLGDRDFAGPGDPLVEALPNATLRTLRNVDHFATPEAFGFIDATLEFLDAVPL